MRAEHHIYFSDSYRHSQRALNRRRRGGLSMSLTTPLTTSQRAYILAHLNDRPRTAVAQAAGVSVSAVYRLVREHGGEMLVDRSRRNPQWVAIVRKHYPTMAGHEIERRFGITANRANKIAQDLGIKHTPETVSRLQREASMRLKISRSKIDFKAKAAKWSARRRLDQFRVWEGKPQQTNFRFATMTQKAYKCKHYLIRTYGYLADEGDPYTLLFDANTRRRPYDGRKTGTESYYTEKYHLKFEKL